MRVIKPLCLSLLSRPFEFRRQFHLGISVMAFIPLSAEPKLLAETAMWPFLAQNLPEGASIDAGMPKQRAEVLATATAYAPGGVPVPTLRAGLQLGSVLKTLNIAGDRLWDGKYASQPKPFTQMPITWARAYGGKTTPENPLGTGADALNASPSNLLPLPNIIDPSGALRPAGFGPLDISWPQRMQYAGTHDAAWLKDHFPGLAPDLDWRFFNLASPDQHIQGGLTGTEPYAFENLHPKQPLITGRLPGIAPRAFVARKGEQKFEEVALTLTTVWCFPDMERLVLVHHGSARIAEEDASDIEYFAAAANPQGQPRPASELHAEFRARMERTLEGTARAMMDSALVPAAWVVPDPDIEAKKKAIEGEGITLSRIRPRLEREHEQARQNIIAQGQDPDKYLPPLPPEEPSPSMEEMPAFIAKKRAEAEAEKAKLDEKVKNFAAEQAAQGRDVSKQLAALEQKPKGPPAFTASGMRADIEGQIRALRVRGVLTQQLEDLLADPANEAQWREAEQKLREIYRMSAHQQAPADPATPQAQAAILAALNAAAPPYDLHGANLAWANFARKNLSNLCLDAADLTGANFEGAGLARTVLAHASARGANFSSADLAAANLGRADLTGANFAAARLREAILQEATLVNANFAGADLEGAILLDAILTGARFEKARAPRLALIKTKLPGWHAPGINLETAGFIESDLSGANFCAANLTGASFITCKLDGANFSGANLTRCVFVVKTTLESCQFAHANLANANFREAAMAGSEFSHANLTQADFSGANLEGALLLHVNATAARFTAANLAKARLTHGNFAAADLARADLRGADLSEANFYEANLARVKLDSATNRAAMQTVRMRYHPIAPPT